MPTENRSSNTEMVSVPREWLNSVALLQMPLDELQEQAIQHLCEPCDDPAPQPHPEPIAWMVGTAIWWTKEEAERDAAATGKTITPIGPMSGIAPAEEHQGDPVAWRGINELGEVVTDWVDGVPPASMLDLCGNPASFAKIEQAYTHADPGEVERLRENHRKHAARLIDERGRLRAQLAERDALLARVVNSGALANEQYESLESECCAISASAPKCKTCHGQGELFVRKGDVHYGMQTEPEPIMAACPDCATPTIALSASAEPSACEHDWVDARNEHVLSGELCAKCHAIRAGNSAAEPSVPVEHDERAEFEACFDRTLKEQEAGLEHYQVSTMRFGKEVMWEGWKARSALERKPS